MSWWVVVATGKEMVDWDRSSGRVAVALIGDPGKLGYDPALEHGASWMGV